MNVNIHNPHDNFFKVALGNVSVTKDLLQRHLPPDIVQRIDWATFELTNKSFVDKKLRPIHSDVVYHFKIDQQAAYLYSLMEHQSTADFLLPFRILQYNVALMKQHLDQGHTKLPIILNLCSYAGAITPYPYSTSIYDCFENPALAREKMFQPFTLIDLTTISEEKLATYGQADLLTLLLKQAANKTFLNWIQKNKEKIATLFNRSYGESGVIYILATDEVDDPKTLMEALVQIAPDKKENIMSAAQILVQQGMEQGIQQGMEQGMQQDFYDKAKKKNKKLNQNRV
jgi:predicted transposase/invertase (TIGR01784 family)